MNMRQSYTPSIPELQSFTACARLGTTTLAAGHLNLTQSAVSRSLATLEDRLGVALFNRVRKRLVLSPAGHAFLDKAEAILAQLDDASVGVMAFGGRTSILRIAALPSFVRSWLIPRLPGFTAIARDISLDISARLDPVDFIRDPVDLAIMRKTHQPTGSTAEIILPENLVVVASPSLLKGASNLSDTDLLNLPLLQQSTRPTLWLDWFRDGEADPRRALRGARLDHFDMVIDAAIAGLGVGIVPHVIARQSLNRGTLVLASGRKFETGDAYALILPDGQEPSAEVRLFRDWLRAAVRR